MDYQREGPKDNFKSLAALFCLMCSILFILVGSGNMARYSTASVVVYFTICGAFLTTSLGFLIYFIKSEDFYESSDDENNENNSQRESSIGNFESSVNDDPSYNSL